MSIIEAIEGRDADLASELIRENTFRLHDYLKSEWENIVDSETEDTSA